MNNKTIANKSLQIKMKILVVCVLNIQVYVISFRDNKTSQ
jgi:hypothetical protein